MKKVLAMLMTLCLTFALAACGAEKNSADDADEKAAIAAAVATVGGVTDRSGVPGVDAGKIEAFYAALAAYVAWND